MEERNKHLWDHITKVAEEVKTWPQWMKGSPVNRREVTPPKPVEAKRTYVSFTTADACWCQPFDGPTHPQCPMHGGKCQCKDGPCLSDDMLDRGYVCASLNTSKPIEAPQEIGDSVPEHIWDELGLSEPKPAPQADGFEVENLLTEADLNFLTMNVSRHSTQRAAFKELKQRRAAQSPLLQKIAELERDYAELNHGYGLRVEDIAHEMDLKEKAEAKIAELESALAQKKDVPRDIAHALWYEGGRLRTNLKASLELHPDNWHPEAARQRLDEWDKAAQRYFDAAIAQPNADDEEMDK